MLDAVLMLDAVIKCRAYQNLRLALVKDRRGTKIDVLHHNTNLLQSQSGENDQKALGCSNW